MWIRMSCSTEYLPHRYTKRPLQTKNDDGNGYIILAQTFPGSPIYKHELLHDRYFFVKNLERYFDVNVQVFTNKSYHSCFHIIHYNHICHILASSLVMVVHSLRCAQAHIREEGNYIVWLFLTTSLLLVYCLFSILSGAIHLTGSLALRAVLWYTLVKSYKSRDSPKSATFTLRSSSNLW